MQRTPVGYREEYREYVRHFREIRWVALGKRNTRLRMIFKAIQMRWRKCS